jgi:hypothetical protein
MTLRATPRKPSDGRAWWTSRGAGPTGCRGWRSSSASPSRTVYLTERYTANAYILAVRTVTAQTPDVAATRAALIAAKPAGLVLDYATVAGQTYDLVRVNFATYAALKAAYPTYEAMRQG